MAERPILFSGRLVRAILEGRKSQTRRVIQPQPEEATSDGLIGHPKLAGYFAPHVFGHCMAKLADCPYGRPGDRLWVRETWALGNPLSDGSQSQRVAYRADGRWGAWCGDGEGGRLFLPHGYVAGHAPAASARDARGNWVGLGAFGDRWRPSIHMPRWASRIDLEVTGIRVERLADITEEDAKAEGVAEPAIAGRLYPSGRAAPIRSYVRAFADLWDGINAKRGFGWAANPWLWVVDFKVAEVRHG